jgi:hypothetical protein
MRSNYSHNTRYEKLKNDKTKIELDQCTFKPEINKTSVPKLKNPTENKALKNYLERQKNVQKKKNEDKYFVDPSIRMKPNISNSVI